MSVKKIIQGWACEGALKSLHTAPKIFMLFTLGWIIFFKDPSRIIAFGMMTGALALWDAKNIFVAPLRLFALISGTICTQIYAWTAGMALIDGFWLATKVAIFITVGLIAGVALSDREIRTLLGKKWAPVVIGGLVGLQRYSQIYDNVSHAQKVRGIIPSGFDKQKLYSWITSRYLSVFNRITELVFFVDLQFNLRGYGDLQASKIISTEFGLADYVAVLLSFALIIIALLPS
ncbi:MAG: hypothetical protein ABW148_06025 [Sedimenticola sp.]